MNVYDFDGTIYDGDSSVDFYIFCLREKPQLILYLPLQILAWIPFLLHLSSKETLKSAFFSFLRSVRNPDDLVERFWEKNRHKIMAWYREQQSPEDVIVSASPAFLLSPLAQILKVDRIIASEIDKSSGRFKGKNCYGAVKVIRFHQFYPCGQIVNFYSDSISDLPLAKLAQRAFIVKNGELKVWEVNAL